MITNTLSAGHLQLPTTPDIPCNFRVQLSILWLVINCLCKTSYCLERLWKQPKEKFSILGHMMKRKKRKSKNKKCNQDHRRSLHCWLKRNICPPPVVDILVVDTNSSYSLLVGRGTFRTGNSCVPQAATACKLQQRWNQVYFSLPRLINTVKLSHISLLWYCSWDKRDIFFCPRSTLSEEGHS